MILCIACTRDNDFIGMALGRSLVSEGHLVGEIPGEEIPGRGIGHIQSRCYKSLLRPDSLERYRMLNECPLTLSAAPE